LFSLIASSYPCFDLHIHGVAEVHEKQPLPVAGLDVMAHSKIT